MTPSGGGFHDYRLNKQILQGVSSAGLKNPTPIQHKVIPLALAGHDMLGISPTGTGKTAAYLIPLIMKLNYPQEGGPRGLILVPTRELAIQVGNEAKKICVYTGLRVLSVFGGKGIKSQIENIKSGTDILVATPGRFLDMYRSGELAVKKIKTLILDEADRMLDMGFIHQIRNILEVIPFRGRQNLLFSATFPAKVEKLSEEFLEFPTRVEIHPQSTATEYVSQIAYKTPNIKTKIDLLELLLQDRERFNRVIIFTKTRKNASDIFKFIRRKIDDNIAVIHANKDQNSRINAMNAFRSGKIRVLVSTDVTARGIDISQVSHVINFDVPVNYEDYIHRIGRTGRAQNRGTAITFLNPPDEFHIDEIRKISNSKIIYRQLPDAVTVSPTDKSEWMDQAREMDKIKRKKDPAFKGAFHEKKKKNKRGVRH